MLSKIFTYKRYEYTTRGRGGALKEQRKALCTTTSPHLGRRGGVGEGEWEASGSNYAMLGQEAATTPVQWPMDKREEEGEEEEAERERAPNYYD